MEPKPSLETPEPRRLRTVRSFGPGRGRITRAQQRAYEVAFPRYQVPFRPDPIEPAAWFGRDAPTVLEIGFGMGETTALIAAAHPELNFLAVEVFEAGIGSLAMRLARLNLGNVRITEHDAVEVVRDMLRPASLAGVHIFFPDPWPKSRHHKRRLIAPAFVESLSSRLRRGGYIHCATDWQHYAEQMMQVLGQEPALRNLHPDFAPAPANPLCERPATKFHARGERLGHQVWDLVFERIA
ncbi:MAG TPA: tRNA (guanosine(46)-N7)-methyltransferase TrmB [Burkholderiaceae bacterium]|nr:tRNA (guanosine(46)-N7)-methyltransferase TrmB [Burkholderiaceae bacterium]